MLRKQRLRISNLFPSGNSTSYPQSLTLLQGYNLQWPNFLVVSNRPIFPTFIGNFNRNRNDKMRHICEQNSLTEVDNA